MAPWYKDLILIFFGWILGLFALPFSKDMEVKEKCLNSLNELEKLFETLSKQMLSPSRTEQRHTALLMEIKPVIKRLNVEKSGLLLSSCLLNDLIAQSLLLFRKFDPEHENCAYHPTQTSVMLISTWGGTDAHNPNFGKIEKIQRFISKPLPKRLIEWFFSLCRTKIFRNRRDESPVTSVDTQGDHYSILVRTKANKAKNSAR